MASTLGFSTPPVPNILLLLFLLLLAWFLVSTLLSYLRLRHIPGPFLAALSHLWIFRTTISGRTDEIYLSLAAKYGPLIRIGPDYLLTSDPSVLRRIAGARSKYGRHSWYSGARFHPAQDTLISLLDTGEHDRMKAKVAGAYSGRESGTDAEAGVDEQIRRLVALIREKYISRGGEPRIADFSRLARMFTLDVITRLGYGKEFGFMDCEDDLYGYTVTADQVLGVISACSDVPLLRNILFSPLVLWLFGPRFTDKRGFGKLMGVTREIVVKRFDKDAEKQSEKDMLGGFIRSGLTQQECEAEVLLALVAGSDTTASAIRVTMLYIMTTPLVYQRLKLEIKQAIEEKRVSSPITAEEAKRLPYLQAVIWEGYRMRPSAIYGHFKKVPPEGDTVLGKFIPGGTGIGHNIIALARSTDIFGRDADVFRPERFLECDAQKKLEMDRAIDVTFGHGRWMCAGKPVAHLELNKIYFELLRKFDFQLVDPEKPWDKESNVLYMHRNMKVKIMESRI